MSSKMIFAFFHDGILDGNLSPRANVKTALEQIKKFDGRIIPIVLCPESIRQEVYNAMDSYGLFHKHIAAYTPPLDAESAMEIMLDVARQFGMEQYDVGGDVVGSVVIIGNENCRSLARQNNWVFVPQDVYFSREDKDGKEKEEA